MNRINKRLVPLLLVLAASVAVVAQPAIPDTPAARQFQAWLEAFNSGDRARVEQFSKEHRRDPGPPAEQTLRFRAQTGGFDLRKIEESTPTRIVALVQERDSDQFARCVIEVEPDPPHRITSMELNAVPRPAEFAVPRLSEGEMVRALEARVNASVAADRFAGQVLVSKRGKTIFEGAFGLADREKQLPNTPDTRFRLGSMNKMFTAVGVLQLVQAGQVALDAPLGKYIPDYPNPDVASKVTIQHLLTHTGGTGDIFGPEFNANRATLRTLADYVTLYGKRGLLFEPGSKWQYSNYGFVLLGVVIERVTGKSYYDDVRERIYVPAGMASTGSEPESESVPNRSIGYTRTGPGEAWRPNTDTLPYRGTSAGGGYSTARDLARFADALLAHKLLDRNYTEMLYTGRVEAGGGGKYAFGFIDNRAGDVRFVGHGGGAPGMNGELMIFPDTGYVVVVLANVDPPAASRIAQFIANRLPAQ